MTDQPKTLCIECWNKQLADLKPDDTGLVLGHCAKCSVMVRLTVHAGTVEGCSTYWPISADQAAHATQHMEAAALERAPTGRAN